MVGELEMKKNLLLLSTYVCVAIKNDGNMDQQNKDNEFVIVRHALEECSGKILYAFIGVIQLKNSEDLIIACQSISMLSETLVGMTTDGETINRDLKAVSESFLTILLAVI